MHMSEFRDSPTATARAFTRARDFIDGMIAGSIYGTIGMVAYGILGLALAVSVGAFSVANFGLLGAGVIVSVAAVGTGIFRMVRGAQADAADAAQTRADLAREAAEQAPERTRAHTPEQSPQPQPPTPSGPAAQSPRPSSRWTDSVERTSSGDRVQSILANGRMGDKDRASAILAEREASAGNSPALG